MRQVIGIAAACVLALSVGVSAQATKKPDAMKKPAAEMKKPAATAAAEHTMTGCVEKGATAKMGMIHNTAEKGPKTIAILDSTATLAPHVGHKVEITGVNVPAADAMKMKPAPAKADHYMKLSAVKMVSATCP